MNIQGWWDLRNILGKATITALNALQLFSWPHLCWEDPWTVLPWLPQLTEKPERVFDATGIRVKAQIINKCRNKMTQKGIYNVRDPPWEGDLKNKKENIVAIWVVSISNRNQFIQAWPPRTEGPLIIEPLICVWLPFNLILTVI